MNTFKNSSIVQFTAPSVTVPGSVPLYFSLNGMYYYPVLIAGAPASFLYYQEVQIISIYPQKGYYDNEALLQIQAINVIPSSLLKCKAKNLIISANVTSINGLTYVNCLLPASIIVLGDLSSPTAAGKPKSNNRLFDSYLN